MMELWKIILISVVTIFIMGVIIITILIVTDKGPSAYCQTCGETIYFRDVIDAIKQGKSEQVPIGSVPFYGITYAEHFECPNKKDHYCLAYIWEWEFERTIKIIDENAPLNFNPDLSEDNIQLESPRVLNSSFVNDTETLQTLINKGLVTNTNNTIKASNKFYSWFYNLNEHPKSFLEARRYRENNGGTMDFYTYRLTQMVVYFSDTKYNLNQSWEQVFGGLVDSKQSQILADIAFDMGELKNETPEVKTQEGGCI